MKKILSFFAMLILVSIFSANLIAQPQHYNYNGTTGFNNAFPMNWPGGRMIQTLIGPGEFSNPTPAPPAGEIETLYLRIGDALGPVSYTEFKILMGQTTETQLTAGTFYTGPMTEVFYRPTLTYSTQIPANSWHPIILDVPFAYNPAQSLVVQIEQRQAVGTTNGGSLNQSAMTNRRVYSLDGVYPWVFGGIHDRVTNLGINLVFPNGISYMFTSNSLELQQNYPNPFINKTIIAYNLIEKTDVVLKVYDLMGQEVSTLVNKSQTSGKYEVEFDGSNLPSGIYLYQLSTNSGNMTKRMIIEK